PVPSFILCGHSMGCALTGWITDNLMNPAQLTVWMGAAVPQYATAAVDPRRESSDLIAKIKPDHLFDFSGGLARNGGKILNFFGDDPVLQKPFVWSVHETACGAYGAWPGPERIPNITDVDVTALVKKHGHYRHLVPLWQHVADETRTA
ncbi:MAG: hypothetical protein ABI995_02735, partial [Acidobacteriota bacterium]